MICSSDDAKAVSKRLFTSSKLRASQERAVPVHPAIGLSVSHAGVNRKYAAMQKRESC
jgi:hypothetical protein